jgi:redox-sensitive bicupin YhaK (pirin superfamily)
MKNTIQINGQQGRLMGLDYFRMMPHSDLKMVGSFFLLDHFPEQDVTAVSNPAGSNIGAHPHRGITTVTYVISGENEHRDSLGNHAVVNSGGLQWMKAGNGIVHDEGPTEAFLTTGGTVHMMQFWLVLNAEEREDTPDYYPLINENVQEKTIDDNGSKLRVLIGKYCSLG